MSGKKTAIITGASGGIGTGLVEGFLQEGYNVVATSRNAHRRLTTSSSLVLVDGDIGKQQTAAYAVEAAINNFGTIDVLVNNAGIFLTRPFTEFTTEDFDALFDVANQLNRGARTADRLNLASHSGARWNCTLRA
jgi:NAD(P)-dependent dehydrogenase (short-subunit alcohol dehydrogenase family)